MSYPITVLQTSNVCNIVKYSITEVFLCCCLIKGESKLSKQNLQGISASELVASFHVPLMKVYKAF